MNLEESTAILNARALSDDPAMRPVAVVMGPATWRDWIKGDQTVQDIVCGLVPEGRIVVLTEQTLMNSLEKWPERDVLEVSS